MGKSGMWSELCLNSALLDQSHLNNFLDYNPPSQSGIVVQEGNGGRSPFGERGEDRFFRGSILSVYWNSSNTIKCILDHPKKRQINAELKIAIEKIAKNEGISNHDFAKMLSSKDHHNVRKIRNQLLGRIRSMAVKYDCVGGRWMAIRRAAEPPTTNAEAERRRKRSTEMPNDIDSFWRQVVLKQLKSNSVHFDSVALTRKIDNWQQNSEKFSNYHVVSFHSNLNIFQEEGRIKNVLDDLEPLLEGDSQTAKFNYESFFVYKPDIFMLFDVPTWQECVLEGLTPVTWAAKLENRVWKVTQTWVEYEKFSKRFAAEDALWPEMARNLECF